MDDDWELAYFGDLSRDGGGDFDGDGAPDLAEFKTGTNPVNNTSVLRVIRLTSLSDGKTTILWNAVFGRTYRVQYKNNVADPAWHDLEGQVLSIGSTASMADQTSTGQPQRFYRVLLVEP